MAFINAVQMIRDVANECIRRGVNVIFEPGWENRGNGQDWTPGGPKGLVNHHTGGGNNIYLDRNLITGVPGLSGPLCNFAGLYDGDLCVVAAFPANHAGASGGWDTAPLPNTGWFNREVLGIEIQYRGTEPMSPEQWRTVTIFNKVCQEILGWPADQSCSKFHQGTSIQGKWDPGYANGKTYDIYDFRRAVIASPGGGTVDPGEEDPMGALNDDEQRTILDGARQLFPLETRNGEKWVGEMVRDLYNEFAYEYPSLYDERHPDLNPDGTPKKLPYKATPVKYILEADYKLESINRLLKTIVDNQFTTQELIKKNHQEVLQAIREGKK